MSMLLNRTAISAVIASTLIVALVQIFLSIPQLAKHIPDNMRIAARRIYYQSWNMFAPPPRHAPTLLVRCVPQPDSEAHLIRAEFDVLRCFASAAQDSRFSVVNRWASYVLQLTGDYITAMRAGRLENRRKAVEIRLVQLASVFCSAQEPSHRVSVKVGKYSNLDGYSEIFDLGIFDTPLAIRTMDRSLTYEACNGAL